MNKLHLRIDHALYRRLKKLNWSSKGLYTCLFTVHIKLLAPGVNLSSKLSVLREGGVAIHTRSHTSTLLLLQVSQQNPWPKYRQCKKSSVTIEDL